MNFRRKDLFEDVLPICETNSVVCISRQYAIWSPRDTQLQIWKDAQRSLEFRAKNNIQKEEIEENAATGFGVMMKSLTDFFEGLLETRPGLNGFINDVVGPASRRDVNAGD